MGTLASSLVLLRHRCWHINVILCQELVHGLVLHNKLVSLALDLLEITGLAYTCFLDLIELLSQLSVLLFTARHFKLQVAELTRADVSLRTSRV